MAEPRKNHLNIDGGQIKEDDNVATYKPIPEADAELRSSKQNLSKSKERVSADGADEKLLPKEEEAKIVTRVDMADAKYVVGDHRNGDAKIELDANKRQFSGLTKEELLKYADDPFWVRLRWFLFILFWAMWLCMLAGAVIIIVRAPKCAAPEPKTWYQKGPLVDMESADADALVAALPLLESSSVQAIFFDGPSYEVLEDDTVINKYSLLFTKAKEKGIKLIVDLIPNFVSKTHRWFQQSENRNAEFDNYFIWKKGDFNAPGSNWVSVYNESAWSKSAVRDEYYLHQYREDQPDLNMREPAVVQHFDHVITKWIKFGAAGVRLQHARQVLVNPAFPPENMQNYGVDRTLVHTEYAFWKHEHTSDQPGLEQLLARWRAVVDQAAAGAQLAEPVFTLEEPTDRPELYLSGRNTSMLRPVSAAPLAVRGDLATLAADIRSRLGAWPATQLVAPAGAEAELALLSLLLPAAPVLTLAQLDADKDALASEQLPHLVELRSDPSVEHGANLVQAVPARGGPADALLAVARWKEGHASYVGVFNPSPEDLRANLTTLQLLPDSLSVYHVSHTVKMQLNYTSAQADDVLVPPLSTVVLQYVLKNAAEE